MQADPGVDKELIPELRTLSDQLAGIKREVAEVTHELTVSQLNWSPAPDRWSMAQCLDHLNKVGSLVLPGLEAAVDQLRAQGMRSDGPFRYSLMERWFIRTLSPDPPMKVPVPKLYLPSAAAEGLTEVVPEFLALQDALLRCITAANGLPLTRIKIASPVSKFVRFSLGAWLQASVAHERYHWLQAREVRANTGFPA